MCLSLINFSTVGILVIFGAQLYFQFQIIGLTIADVYVSEPVRARVCVYTPVC